ncbi:MAG: Branched-chain amino acid aminotransferase [Phycisphaerales bacterium]|jgi:branched-chain amino acid aminotransferase|nr:Branched-chain amino acid aminotransferase [Phycisphaerales bacterium]MDB5354140.1 Branched-chain amino acid aminotransferase [Phycisphaerales bacterium]
MSLKVWIDGRLIDKADAKISVYDHGLLYGDGVFEGIRIYHGKVFEPDAHLRRLFDSAKAIRLTIPYTPVQLKAAIDETAKANHFTDCYIRLVVTRGSGYLGLSPAKCPTPAVFIITDTIELYPKEMYEKGMAVITASVIRNHPNALSPRIKSLNYLNNILAKIEASDAGVPEAIMLNHDGNVAECTADNLFIARGGVIQTPTTHDGILEGVTREVILTLCKRMSIPCQERTLQRHDLYIADECFLTGTGAEVVPVTKIDGRQIANGEPGPLTRKLMEAFRRYIKESAEC